MQGSAHFILIHALLDGHSLLLEHSGLQYGGEPRKSGIQVQDGVPEFALQMEFGPQGDGVHGVPTSSCVGARNKMES